MASTAPFAIGASNNQLVVAGQTQGALVPTTTKEALCGSIAAVERSKRELATLVRGKAGELDKSLLQRARKVAEFAADKPLPLFGATSILGVVGGFVLGAMGGMLSNSGTVFYAVWAGLGTLFVSSVPVCLGIAAAARTQERIVKRRMVELPDLRGQLERFRSAEGAQKVQLGLELVKLRDALESQRILAPEARVALQDAAAEAEALPEEQKAKAARLETLAREISGPITALVVSSIGAQLSTAEPAERVELATALRELLFTDRKRLGDLDYDVRNTLHAVLEEAKSAALEEGN